MRGLRGWLCVLRFFFRAAALSFSRAAVRDLHRNMLASESFRNQTDGPTASAVVVDARSAALPPRRLAAAIAARAHHQSASLVRSILAVQ